MNRPTSSGKLPSKIARIHYLECVGWTAFRERGEPIRFRDPLGCVVGTLRVDEAWALQMRREKNGVRDGAGRIRET